MNFVAIGKYWLNLDNVVNLIVEKDSEGKTHVFVRLLLGAEDNRVLEFKGRAAERLLNEIKRRTTPARPTRSVSMKARSRRR